MTARPTDDPVLRRFEAALDATYGDHIDRVVLFGSRARGDAHGECDYDVAVFLKSLSDRWRELDRLADLRMELLAETGAFFDTKPYLTTAYQQRSPLMREIRRDGVELSLIRHANSSPRPRRFWQSSSTMSSAAPHISQVSMLHRHSSRSEPGDRSRHTRACTLSYID